MSRVWRVGKRPNTSTAQTPPQCRAISPPPPQFHAIVWVAGPLLVVLKVREGIHFLFVGVLVFLSGVKKWVHSDTKRWVCYSFPPPSHVCPWYGVA